jgi:hypothetical protein
VQQQPPPFRLADGQHGPDRAAARLRVAGILDPPAPNSTEDFAEALGRTATIQGDREPWTHMLEHEQERDIPPKADLDDGTLVYR